MPSALLVSKLYIPPLRPNLVPRPRLVQALDHGLRMQRRLTLVSAPAGFGKTTLVVAWLKAIQRPAVWLSLDEADNDLGRFLTYLAAAFQQVDEGIGAPLQNVLQSPQLPDVEKALVALLNEIALRAEPLILALDDYHLITEPGVLQAAAFLLEHLPPQLHLVLTTREDPDLPLARLRVRDQLTEVRAWDLRFTQDETNAFFREVMGLSLSAQEVAALEDRTEGWAAGLQLAGLSMQKQADLAAFIAAFSGSHRYVLDYLTEEVLHQQPEDVQSFLLHTSILDRLNGSLCDALTGRDDGEAILAQLEADNLFVIPLDEERRWYRYHHLFADLLRNQLTRTQPEQIPELHRRASRWYEEHGNVRAAVDHALQDPGLTLAAAWIGRHAIPMLYQGEVAMVVEWFDRLPERTLDAAPMLCIDKAWSFALMQRGARREEVEHSLRAADLALERSNADAPLRDLVAGHAASIRAFLRQAPSMSGETPETLIALSQEAQRLLPEDEKAIRSVNALNIGYGYLALADLPSARTAFEQTLEDGLEGGNLYAAIYGPIGLVLSALLAGRLSEALQLCEANLKRFNRLLAGQNFPPVGALYILKGSIHLEYNRLAEAGQALAEGVDLVRWTGEYEAHNKGYTSQARLHAIQGNRPAMLEAVKTLEETWPEGALYAQALRHRLSMRHWPNDPQVRDEAHAWLTQSGIAFDRLALIDSVDPISTAYFEGYLGAAHVMARLAQARPSAYPLEDAQTYLERHQRFAAAHAFTGPVVEIAIARALLYHAAGNKAAALEMLAAAVRAAAPTGLFRIFVDECEPVRSLLEALRPTLTGKAQAAYPNRLLDAMECAPVAAAPTGQPEALLSERELEVLRLLANGLAYEEIGQQLFLSLNTIQFHVKNIYGKLLVHKRAQAIEKARALNLI